MQTCVNRSFVPTPPVTITVQRSRENGLSWITPWDRTMALWQTGSSSDDCVTLLHEIGHAFDWEYLRPADRRYVACDIFRERRYRWWSYRENENEWIIGGEARMSALERFASAYTLVALIRKPPRTRINLWPVPVQYGLGDHFDRRRFVTFRAFVRRAALRERNTTSQHLRPVPC